MMSIIDAILVGLFVMAIVFAVLVALSFMIDAISFVMKKLEPHMNKAEDKKTEAKAIAESESVGIKQNSNTSVGKLKLSGVDEKTAAMVMAIISDELDTPLAQLDFVSIRALD